MWNENKSQSPATSLFRSYHCNLSFDYYGFANSSLRYGSLSRYELLFAESRWIWDFIHSGVIAKYTDAKTKETRNRGRWDVNNGLGSCLSTTYGRVLQLLLVLSCRPYGWRLCLNSRDYVLRTMMYGSFRS